MMNLLGIRTDFVEKTGRHDLVVDTTDYVDNGANYFIQAAQRLLDSILPYRKDVGRYITTINADQSSVILKYIRAYDSVYVKGSGAEREDLERKTYSWLVEQYGDDFGEKASGMATFSGTTTDGDTLVIGGETYTFKTSPSATYDVQIGSTASATIDNLVSKIRTVSSIADAQKYSTTQCLITYYLVGTAGNAIVFTDTSTHITLDGSGLLGGSIAGRANQIGTGQPVYWAPLVTNPHPDLLLSKLPTEDSHDILFGLDRFQRDGVLFMPPADASYTMTLYGLFFSKMEEDADVSYHSEMYPELLSMMSALVLEAFYRNTTGVTDWLSPVRLILEGIDHDLVREEMVLSGNQLRG
jgi:hypothetical protein